jgi:hypothetical protein
MEVFLVAYTCFNLNLGDFAKTQEQTAIPQFNSQNEKNEN